MSAAKMVMVHKTDPKKDILEKLGPLEYEVPFNNILIAIYQRPEALDLGGGKMLYLTDKQRNEDKFQGKVGLVLRKGPMAFVDDNTTKFHGQNVDEGDWIVFRPSDGFQMLVNGVLCREIEDVHYKGRIPRPDYVY